MTAKKKTRKTATRKRAATTAKATTAKKTAAKLKPKRAKTALAEIVAPLHAANGPRHCVFIDVENTSSEARW